MNKAENLKELMASAKHADTATRASIIEESLIKLGVRNISDIINPDPNGKLFKASNRVLSNLSNNNIALAASGDPLLNGTALIVGVMEEVTPFVQPTTASMLFPEAEYSSQKLLLDIFQPIIGMTHNTAMDEPSPEIVKRGINTIEFQPATSREHITINQQEALFLRNPGDQNIAIRGLATYMAKWTEQLSHRGVVKRLNDIYTAIFTQQYTWKNKVLSYGIPASNTIYAYNLSGGAGGWGTLGGNASATTPNTYNSAANPILDFSQILNQVLARYRGLKMKLVMNPKTNQLIVQNPNVISRVPFIYANNSLVSTTNPGGVTTEMLLKYFLGGDLGVEVEIDNSVYIADANDPNGNAFGTINYILPDYKIWVYIDTDGFGKPLGEYAYTLAAQNGGLLNPRAGKYFNMIDTTGSQTLEGYEQPRMYLVHGWNGSPWIMRRNDIWTIDVAPNPNP